MKAGLRGKNIHHTPSYDTAAQYFLFTSYTREKADVKGSIVLCQWRVKDQKPDEAEWKKGWKWQARSLMAPPDSTVILLSPLTKSKHLSSSLSRPLLPVSALSIIGPCFPNLEVPTSSYMYRDNRNATHACIFTEAHLDAGKHIVGHLWPCPSRHARRDRRQYGRGGLPKCQSCFWASLSTSQVKTILCWRNFIITQTSKRSVKGFSCVLAGLDQKWMTSAG